MIVGIDVGTQSLKAVVLSPDLDVLGKSAISFRPKVPRPGWAEQDPALWERALGPAIAGALGEAGAAAKDVQALGLAGQLDGCVPVDASGAPMHPCLIWMDRRATAETEDIDPELISRSCGVVLDAQHPAAKIRWLKAHHPETRRARCFHGAVSYLVSRLTGRHVIDHATASLSMVYTLASRAYDDALLGQFGIERSEMPVPLPAHDCAGPLTRCGHDLTGLPEGIPVAVGTGDDFSSGLGAGLTRPGRLLDVLGTAEVVGALHSEPVIDAGQLVETHAYPAGGYFIENPGWLSGGALAWFRETFRLSDFAELDRMADGISPGAEGVTFIPALTGAMTPEWNPAARGTFFGLTPAHGAGHLARSVLEGTAFGMRDVLERVISLGAPGEAIRVVGGGAKSRLWRQMRADLTGLPVETPRHVDTSPIGAGLLAAVAAGLVPDVQEGAATLDRGMNVIAPNAASRRAYDDAYRRYRRVFDALKPLF